MDGKILLSVIQSLDWKYPVKRKHLLIVLSRAKLAVWEIKVRQPPKEMLKFYFNNVIRT